MKFITPEQADERPDYFAPAPSAEDAVLRRIKGNFRRNMISKNLVSEGLASIPELWCAHEIPENFKATLTTTAGPQARGGEDLPDLIEDEVEIARLTLIDSVHGEVTSLRARRDPKDLSILLSMVDEYETEFKLPKNKVSAPLTAAEVMVVFRDADPTPLATSCQIEFASVFYLNLHFPVPEGRRSHGENSQQAKIASTSNERADLKFSNDALRIILDDVSEALRDDDSLGIVVSIGPFIYFIAKSDSGLRAKVAVAVSEGSNILGAIFLKRNLERVSTWHRRFQRYEHDESATKILQMALEKVLKTPDVGKKSELLNISEIQSGLRAGGEANALRGNAPYTEGVSRPGDSSAHDAKTLAEELRGQSAHLNNDSHAREAALNKPHHIFFFSALDGHGTTRFFDIMKQEDGFSLAETATSAPRLCKCVETVYVDPGGGAHHVHRNYGKFRTGTAFQAMEEFVKLTALSQIIKVAETLNQRQALPTWKVIFESLGCESVAFIPKDVAVRQVPDISLKANPLQSMIDFAKMIPVMPDAELADAHVRVIMPNGKCFDIPEELWTKAREIESQCVIMSRKATAIKQN